jgi:hypothetical protein
MILSFLKKRKYVDVIKFCREEYDISGVATGVGFGRGGAPREVRIILYNPQAPNISGVTTAVGFGRGGTPREVGYVLQKTERDERRS